MFYAFKTLTTSIKKKNKNVDAEPQRLEKFLNPSNTQKSKCSNFIKEQIQYHLKTQGTITNFNSLLKKFRKYLIRAHWGGEKSLQRRRRLESGEKFRSHKLKISSFSTNTKKLKGETRKENKGKEKYFSPSAILVRAIAEAAKFWGGRRSSERQLLSRGC